MLKRGIIKDAATGQGIPYATVEITDVNGVYLGAGVSADVQGSFTIDSMQMQPGSYMRISSVGYGSQSFPYDVYLGRSVFTLSPVAQQLPPVTVTVPAAGTDKNKIALAVAAGLALLLFMRK